jgi:hypothetical protein
MKTISEKPGLSLCMDCILLDCLFLEHEIMA